MVDRRLVFGDPADAGTRWAMEDADNAAGGGNFVIARDLDGGGVLLQYNPTTGNFEPFAPVDLGGQNIEDGATTVYDAATDTVGDGTTSADHQSVNTNNLDINGETLVEAEKTIDQAYSSANGWVTLTFDTEVADANSNWDGANNEFIPPETGSYQIVFQATFSQFSSGDLLRVRFEQTDGSAKGRLTREYGATGIEESVLVAAEKELSGGEPYEPQVRNQNSDDNILGEADGTFLTISRSEEN